MLSVHHKSSPNHATVSRTKRARRSRAPIARSPSNRPIAPQTFPFLSPFPCSTHHTLHRKHHSSNRLSRANDLARFVRRHRVRVRVRDRRRSRDRFHDVFRLLALARSSSTTRRQRRCKEDVFSYKSSLSMRVCDALVSVAMCDSARASRLDANVTRPRSTSRSRLRVRHERVDALVVIDIVVARERERETGRECASDAKARRARATERERRNANEQLHDDRIGAEG